MTLSPEGASSPPGKKGRLVKVALALSLALNVFFVGGLVYTKFFWHRPPPLLTLAGELDLTPDQRKTFREFTQTVHNHGMALRDANLKLGAQIWDELAKPQPDPDKIAQIFTQVADNRRDFQAAVSKSLLPFLESLTPEQRTKFIEIAKHHQDLANRMRFLGMP